MGFTSRGQTGIGISVNLPVPTPAQFTLHSANFDYKATPMPAGSGYNSPSNVTSSTAPSDAAYTSSSTITPSTASADAAYAAIWHPRYSAPLVRVPSTTNEDIDGGVSRYTTLNDCTITFTASGDIHAIEIALSSPSPVTRGLNEATDGGGSVDGRPLPPPPESQKHAQSTQVENY
jgi:hypothetical protein